MDTSEEFRLAKKAIHGNPEAYGSPVYEKRTGFP